MYCTQNLKVQVHHGGQYVVVPGRVLPYMGYIGMYDPKGYGFSVVLIINRIWFYILVLYWACFLEEATFSSFTTRLSKIMFRATVPGTKVMNRVSNFSLGHKYGRENHRCWSLIA